MTAPAGEVMAAAVAQVPSLPQQEKDELTTVASNTAAAAVTRELQQREGLANKALDDESTELIGYVVPTRSSSGLPYNGTRSTDTVAVTWDLIASDF